ncbi:MAG TPA: FAD-dependent oxidoreductase, partial [Bacteroidota bacterium]|nr:FAD-dependent oxidoreductase [Bacteroidota bacterium]
MHSESFECCIIGAGPAGLAAALELTGHGVTDVVIIDRHNGVGGLSRTESFAGARFDVGPHRFFTKNAEINRLWHETLKGDFIPVRRLTRIFYKNKFYSYPINAKEALANLGFAEAGHALLSYAAAALGPRREPVTFEDWITGKFGRKLYEAFFKTYTEKVWGIPCT